MSTVKAINTSSVHRICSGQVILDLATAIKELVENSLDAQAKSIEIRFKEYGIQSVEIIDDGTGIHPNDYESLALKHHTSKLSSFEDLTEVDSFGFRGEALSSLCALSKLIVSTCIQEEIPTGTKLEYDSHGRLIKKSPTARGRGTSVILQGLFESIPVRYREFKKNIKREFGKALVLLQAYCIICENVRITCTNQSNNNAKTKVLTTSGNSNIRDNIANIFGAKTLTQIIPLNINVEVKQDKRTSQKNDDDNNESERYTFQIVGHISKPVKGCGRGSNDRQYYFINGRPCNLPKIAKVINELYKSFNTNQYPFVVIDFRLAKSSYDVNVSPDKRTIFIHNENKIVKALREEMNNILEPFRSTFVCSNAEDLQLSIKENVLCYENSKREISSQNKNAQYKSGILLIQDGDDDTVTLNNIQGTKGTEGEFESTNNLIQPICALSNTEEKTKIKTDKSARCALSTTQLEESEAHVMKKLKISMKKLETVSSPENRLSQFLSSSAQEKRNYLINDQKNEDEQCAGVFQIVDGMDIEQEEQMKMIFTDSAEEVVMIEEDMNDSNEDVIITKEDKDIFNKNGIIGDNNNNNERFDIEIPFDIQRYKLIDINWQDFQKNKDKNNDCDTRLNNAGINNQDNEVAEKELNRVISKRDFDLMEIVGQFNLGFIIVKLDNSNCNDLFIIDQHASDEKYNFETLQLHTKIQSQRLISPRKLEFTAAEELVAIENLKILQANGFELDVDYDASPTNKLKLLAQPMSKDIVFGIKDLEELIFLLSEQPGEMVRCSQIRHMFASRACRKSIMIGDALNRQQMEKIVKHMGDIDQPWNCPHGRPTMRHLFDLSQIESSQPYTMRPKSNQSNLYNFFKKT